ncbi:MAG: Gfo/Idh/MocA family oxidoreductase [Planctomycetota bacterium]|nr:Gfo/Idh/MocA family oxidoreductase [Planctomycetota bacterium]MDA1178225.1 Gfo/Idh/MocA family oxidoreductase [Planctomycetota bacterium]
MIASQNEPERLQTGRPALTVVVVAPKQYSVIQRTMAHLARQTIASQIEVLLMTTSPDEIVVPEAVAHQFWDVRRIDIGEERRVGAIRAMGIEEARAEFAAMSEDHCYMNAVWAEALLKHHAEGADVVGPVMTNANPGTLVSWVAYFVAYGPWADVTEAERVGFLPGHNSSYRCQTVLAKGKKLRELMSSEVILHWALRDEGATLICEPAARCRHVNLTHLGTLAKAMYDHSRNFGALRGQSMSGVKKLMYVIASPIIPVLRTLRTYPTIRRHLPAEFSRWKAVSMLARILISSAAGEVLGILRGSGQSPWADWDMELDRRRFLRDADVFLVEPSTPVGDDDPIVRHRAADDPVRVGLIGAGRLGREVHLRCLKGMPQARVVAIAESSVQARHAATAMTPGAHAYETADELLADAQVEAVIIATPTATHAQLTCDAFAAGKHVYLEKPIATTVAEGQSVIDAWRQSGKVGVVGFNYRHRPDYQRAAALVAANRLGNIKLVSVTFTTQCGQAQGWRQGNQTGGGVLLDLASHEFDLVHFVLGVPIVSIQAFEHFQPHDAGQTIHVYASTASGIVVRGFFSSETTAAATMEIVGTAGKIKIDRYDGLVVDQQDVHARGAWGRFAAAFRNLIRFDHFVLRRRSPWNEVSFSLALSRFVFGVANDVQPAPNLCDGLHSLRIVQAAEESLATGEAVNVLPKVAETGAVAQ